MTQTIVAYCVEKLPSIIEKDKVKYYVDTWNNNAWFISRNVKVPADYRIYYYNSSLRKTLYEVRGESWEDCTGKMLALLSEQNP